MPVMTSEHSTNVILDDLDSRNLNWVGLNYVLDGSTGVPFAMSSGSIEKSSIRAYREPFVTLAHNSTSALTVPLSSGNVFKVNMSTTITSIAYTGESTSETVPFTLHFYPLSTNALTIAGQTAYSVCAASTNVTAVASSGFTGVFATQIEPGDIIDVTGFNSTGSTVNTGAWYVESAAPTFIAVYNSSTLVAVTTTNGTITRRRDIFAGGATGFTAPTPFTPTAYVGYTFDGDRYYMAAVGEF